MSIVAGVDFGTLSVRVSIFDSVKGRLGAGAADYPLLRKKEDPDYATQSHADHMSALALATRRAIANAGIDGHSIEAIALDTTGSSVIPVDSQMRPIDDYYLWCDHRAWKEAGEITGLAHRQKVAAIDWCGGIYSSEWGFAKLPTGCAIIPGNVRTATALEHCDMVAALCGITDPMQVPRSICAMGHKWLSEALGGLPPEGFLTSLDPAMGGIRAQLGGRYATSEQLAGHLTAEWADKLGLRAGIPIPVGAFDAHWDAIGAGVRLGDVVNVVGTDVHHGDQRPARPDSGRVRRGSRARYIPPSRASRPDFRRRATSSKRLSTARRHYGRRRFPKGLAQLPRRSRAARCA